VTANIARVEQTLAASVDLQCIGVVGGMIHQIRRYAKGAEDQRKAVAEIDRLRGNVGPGNERRGGFQDTVRSRPKRDRQLGARKMRQAPMVDVTVRQNQSAQVAGVVESVNLLGDMSRRRDRRRGGGQGPEVFGLLRRQVLYRRPRFPVRRGVCGFAIFARCFRSSFLTVEGIAFWCGYSQWLFSPCADVASAHERARASAWNMRRVRVAQGISQEKLAADAAVDRAYLGGLERQVENPTVDLLDRIAAALSIPLGELFLQPLPGEKPPKPMPGGRRKVARRVSPVAPKRPGGTVTLSKRRREAGLVSANLSSRDDLSPCAHRRSSEHAV
jgi:DNA-binding XRE family transcriptional regulator